MSWNVADDIYRATDAGWRTAGVGDGTKRPYGGARKKISPRTRNSTTPDSALPNAAGRRET